jgi:hypothetical protein
MPDNVLETLAEGECLRLISPGGIGRLAYEGRNGLTVFPVSSPPALAPQPQTCPVLSTEAPVLDGP